MFQARFKKIYIALFMLLFLTGCSSEEILSEVPQTIVLPVEEIDSLPGQEAEEPTAESDNTESCSLLEEGGSRFAYESLDAQEQIWYGEIEQALGEMTDTVKLSTEPIEQGLDEQDIDRIFQCVLIDHPEIFYTTGYTYTKYSRGDRTVGIDFAGTYSLPGEEAVRKAEEIRERASEWLSEIPSDVSEYDKVKAVYEKIIFSTDYDLNASDNQNIASVFLGNSSVCQGYAKATQYLLNHLGVMCTLVQGTVDTGEAHAWNLVRIGENYYYVDTTWSSSGFVPEEDSIQDFSYTYLCCTAQTLERSHVPDDNLTLPECKDDSYNYYKQNQSWYESYDESQIYQVLKASILEKREKEDFKFANEEAYQQAVSALAEGNLIEQAVQEFYSFDGENSYRWNVGCSDAELLITVYW